MNVFFACLRKEWMDLRSWAVTLLISVPVLAIAYCIGFPEQWHKFSNITLLCGTLSMMLAGLSLGGRLVGGEVSGAGMRFLDRLPNGLPVSFLVKATLLILALIVCTLHGNVVACVLRSLAFGEHGHWHMVFSMKQWAPLLAFLGPTFGLMAMSAWMPRSGMTLPGLVLLYLVTLGPAWLAFDLMPGLAPALREVLIAWFVISAGLVVAAGASFIRGYRRSGGPLRSLLNGGLVLLLFTLPVWGWTGYRVWRWVHCDPTAADIKIYDAFVGADRRTAWLTVIHMEPDMRSVRGSTHTVRVDLESGEWERDGGVGSWYHPVGILDHSSRVEARTGFPALLVRSRHDNLTHEVFSTRSGKVLYRLERGAPFNPIADSVRAVKRATTPFRLADGRRLWYQEGNFETETREGGVEIVLRTNAVGGAFWPESGVPSVRLQNHKSYICDLDRGIVTDRELFQRPSLRAVLQAGYLLEIRKGRGKGVEWLLADPETKSTTAAMGFHPRERVWARHDRTRVWVHSIPKPDGIGGPLFLLDPVTGKRQPVPCRGVEAGTISAILDPTPGRAPARTPDERRVFILWLESGHRQCLARFDESKGTLTRTVTLPRLPHGGSGLSLLACPDNDTAIVLRDQRFIERLYFGSDKREILFPRP